MSGYGYTWGGLPWGGAFIGSGDSDPSDEFGIFCFVGDSLDDLLSSPSVTVDSESGQIDVLPGPSISINSGGSDPTSDVRISISSSVPQSWTLELNAQFSSLPNDFSSLITNHVFFGSTDSTGPCAGLFISKVGIAYTGGVSHDGSGNMQLDSAFEVLPGSSAYVNETDYITFRIAADLTTSAVYVYITRTADIPFTGHQLRYILPVIPASDLANPPLDRTLISVRGSLADSATVILEQICLGNGLIIPNLPPRADAGRDQSIRVCNVALLDGSMSFDPEGSPLIYAWHLIDAPEPSIFSFDGGDGFTVPDVSDGFTDKFYSAEAGSAQALDPFVDEDILLVNAVAYRIIATGVDGNGFYVQTTGDIIPDNISNSPFKILRQRGISGPTTVKPTFFPDVPGIYKFDLVVSDGGLFSESSVTIINVLESATPKGIIPDLGFIWNYLSDFWNLVEDRDRIGVFFEALTQVAAGELLTLWQTDYSKSIRDIQRTFQRRWLHYDLLLAEPIPELTKTRQIRSGVLSSEFSGAGIGSINGTKLVLSSPVRADLTVTFGIYSDPYDASEFVTELNQKLSNQDSRFSATLIQTASSTEGFVRINSTIPFSISVDTTVPVFNDGDVSGVLSGSTGLRLGIRTYKVDLSLEDLDIQEDDILIINGEGYLISRVIDDPSDDLRFQRIVVQSDLPTLPGNDWSISGHTSSKLIKFYNGLVSAGDYAYYEVIDLTTQNSVLIRTNVLGAVAEDPGKIAVDLTSIDGYLAQPTAFKVNFAKVVRRTYLPVNELVTDIPTLQSLLKPADDSQVLRRNIDYFIEQLRDQQCIRFVTGDSPDPDIWEGEVPPDRLWAEITFLDNSPTIESNFGIPVDFTLDKLAEAATDIDYLSAVRGLWYAFLNGPTLRNLRVGTQILLGLPFAEEAGVIDEIRTDFSPNQGRILVHDQANPEVVRSYSYPRDLDLEINPATGAQYKIGDSVEQFAPLVSGAEVIDYVKDPRWFEGILNQGVFFEVEKFFKFMVRVDSSAFSLQSLMFVKDFILKIKPTYTYPLFIVKTDVEETEVDVTDEVSYIGRLNLYDGACSSNPYGMATMFDQPRSAGGGYFSDFDGNSNPNDTPVESLYPTPQVVSWGYDKQYLCPEDEIVLTACTDFAGGTVSFDAIFTYDAGTTPSHIFAHGAETSVPAGPAGQTLTGSPSAVTSTGVVEEIYISILGDPGSDPTDYEVVIARNGADEDVLAFTVGSTGFIGSLVSAGVAVTGGDNISIRIRPATGGARAPNWTDVYVRANQTPVTWTFDDGLPAGFYCSVKAL